MSPGIHRRGFSLLEVMLATIILLGAIVVLGELARLGSRNVQAACAETEAERLAQSVLSRVASNGLAPEMVRDAPLEEFPGWLYSIEVEPLDRPALSSVRITVRQDLPEEKQPIEFSVVRWVRTTSEDLGDDPSPPPGDDQSFDEPAARSVP